jgi:glycosyltransferase involved in cell wall biosynthesis
MNEIRDALTFVVYTADLWEHVCPTVRITGPAAVAGVDIIRGNEWREGGLQIYPERVVEADLVIIQRNFPENIQAYEEIIALARARHKAVVYELDDLILELPDQHPDFYHYLISRSAILRAVSEADAVIGSTPALCETLRHFNPNTWMIPNYLNDQLWELVSPSGDDGHTVTIGYLGSHSHTHDLEIVAPTLSKILTDYKEQVAFKCWGIAPPAAIQNFANVEWVDPGLVNYAEFAAYFVEQHCDLFIAPLADNAFNRAKSWLKYLEYSALGVPGVFSRITPYESVLEHGKIGFLASTNAEWELYLRRLIEDPGLRVRVGANAQAHLRSEWLLSDHIDQWKHPYHKIIAAPRQPKPRAADRDDLQKLLFWQSNLERKSHSLHRQLTEASQQYRTHLEATEKQLEAARRELDAAHNESQSIHSQLDETRLELDTHKVELEELRLKLSKKDHEFTDMHQTARHFHLMYLEIYNSRSWRLMGKFQRIRLKLIPKDGKLENLLRSGVRALAILRHEGFKALLQAVRRRLDGSAIQQPTMDAAGSGQITPSISISDGAVVSFPAISILLIHSGDRKAPEIQSVQAWLEAQTLPSAANIVVWDTQVGQAWYARGDPSSRNNDRWSAPDIGTVSQNLNTRYLCVASFDLLEQPQTYLEYNLLVLETESLAFTVNLRGGPDWIAEKIDQGLLPGNQDAPLLHLIARKEYVQDGFSIDLSQWLESRNGRPGAAGRVVLQTTNFQDEAGSLPFSTQIVGGETKLFGHRILARSTGSGWETADLQLHPVDTVLPIVPLKHVTPGGQKSAIMVHPYLAVGGAEQVHLKIIQELKDKIQFAVVTFEPLHPEMGTTADAYREVTPLIYTLPDFLSDPLYWSFMVYLIKRLQPHTLYIANGTPWIYDHIAEIKRRHPGLRTVDQVYDASIGWIHRYDQSVAMYVDAHIGVNSKIRDVYIAKGARPADTHLVENGIDPEELDPADYPAARVLELKRKFGLPEHKNIVTFASRIHQQKRPMDFIELARRSMTDKAIAFFMVGDGPLAGAIDDQIQNIGLDNLQRIPFHRPVSEVLAVTDVLLLPSEFEGMPMIVIEAQAMGKPVVVTDVGNNREILERTQGGIVVSRIGDIESLVGGVHEMLNHPPDPSELRRSTLAHFDIAKVAQRYLEILLG